MIRKKWIATTDSNHPYPRYPNLMKGYTVRGLNQAWVADITYIRILTTFVYLAVILDVFSRKVIGYAISKRLETQLTLEALRRTLQARSPRPGCIHHSDQGVQYASIQYVELLKQQGFQISMSRKGNPYDNAMAESFMKTLKHEEVYLWDYETLADVEKRVPFFIEEVYNKKRLHSSLGYVPPNEFEEGFIQKSETLTNCQLVTI
jgi:transposase InsO family protein